MFLVGERSLVAAEGDEGATIDDIEALLKSLDFEKLGGLTKKAKPAE